MAKAVSKWAIGAGLILELQGLRGVEYPQDPGMAARLASYELAFRMQRSVPEAVDFSRATEERKQLCGLDLPH